MTTKKIRLSQAWLDSLTSGVVELTSDWTSRYRPLMRLECPHPIGAIFDALPARFYGDEAAYFCETDEEIWFCLRADRVPEDYRGKRLFVAGSFNGWNEAIGKGDWQLKRAEMDGHKIYFWRGRSEQVFAQGGGQFKFATEDGEWLPVPIGAPNTALDGSGNRNYGLDPAKTGRHRFSFRVATPLDLSVLNAVSLIQGAETHRTYLRQGEFFFRMKSELPMGAIVEKSRTVFRLFAPRASSVKVGVFSDLKRPAEADWFRLAQLGDGAWETAVPSNLDGSYYWFRVDGPSNEFGHFDPEQNILDPYARATVTREGPGIILDSLRFDRGFDGFRTPSWQDLVVMETHVRDLAAHAPVLLKPRERLGFTGARKWIDHRNSYLRRLGVNAVEFQPLQAFDTRERKEYGWGYMPVNYFAPEKGFSLEPENASGVSEVRSLVESCHRNGMAVILDVVYNHVGEPNHLLFIDKLYYFDLGKDGSLANWSGCGNDLRCDSAMSRRLIIESLIHWVKAYGVDGFRFDLAELIGKPALVEIEKALKRVKPDVILIAEPWSFRSHIAAEMRDTGYASWNDGFRNFMREFVRGHSPQAAAEYYLKGSPWHFARWPAQTVNYTESHDDRTWIDVMTENGDGNGNLPTINDVRRTHLMVAFMMASVGIPMLHAGQDFLRSKYGVNNTYQRGDINAYNYRRLFRFPGTHDYFAAWIRFRLGPWGELLRHYSRPADGYFSFIFPPDSPALAVVVNADGSRGPRRLLLAMNPNPNDDAEFDLGDWVKPFWRQIADHERFLSESSQELHQPVENPLFLAPISLGLWVTEV